MRNHLIWLFHYLLPKKFLTLLCGTTANVQQTWFKNWLIKTFIKQYQVNMAEALKESPEDYLTFNDFFIRALKPSVRTFAQSLLISPVDGCISQMGRINKTKMIQAKGREYTVQALLDLPESEKTPFDEGLFTTLYLSPKDYHRVHMPIDGLLKKVIYLPGQLFSVQPKTTELIPSLFAQNERCVCYFETAIGMMAFVFVGATIVGKIGLKWQGELKRCGKKQIFDYSSDKKEECTYRQGEEIGYFKLGSTVIILLENHPSVDWSRNLQENSLIRLGDALT